MLGLNKNEVILSEYDEKWEKIAKNEIEILNKTLKDIAIDIQHIGSTAIKGFKAKPIIDIQIGLNNLDDIMKYKEQLQEKGFFIEKSKRQDEERLFIVKDAKENTISIVHAVIYKSNTWNNCILFRDALNKYENLRKIYLNKKEELSIKYKDDRKSYTKEKQEIIIRILELANKLNRR